MVKYKNVMQAYGSQKKKPDTGRHGDRPLLGARRLAGSGGWTNGRVGRTGLNHRPRGQEKSVGVRSKVSLRATARDDFQGEKTQFFAPRANAQRGPMGLGQKNRYVAQEPMRIRERVGW